MSKTFQAAIASWIKRKSLRRRGIVIHHHTVFSGVEFLGNAVIEPYCRISGDPKVVIGDNFYMNVGCHIQGNISIGRDVMIGPKTIIWGRDHGMSLGKPMKNQDLVREDIFIGNDVWIGASVTILKGVEIGDGVVIGAGAVVTSHIPSFAIAAGNPARVIKFRK